MKEYQALREKFEKYLLYRRLIQGKQTKQPIRSNTVKLYWYAVKSMLFHLHNPNPRVEEIQNYYETVLSPKNPNSLTAFCVGINHYCDMRKLNFHLPYHAPKEIDLDIWTEKEVKALINEPLRVNDLRSHSIFLVLRETGQRQMDVRGLNQKAIDYDNRQVTMFINKLAEKHTFNITAETLSVIADYIAKQRIEPKNDKEAVWTSKKCRISQSWLYNRVRVYASEVGISKNSHPHIFRHYAINNALEKGIPPKTVMAMFFIKNYRTLLRYSHPTRDSIRHDFDRLHGKQTTETELSSPLPNAEDTLYCQSTKKRDTLYRLYRDGKISKRVFFDGVSELDNSIELNYIG